LPAMPYRMNEGQDKTFWITYNEPRGKQVLWLEKLLSFYLLV
jgi:hypothetical protein